MAKLADFLEKLSSDEAFEKEFDKNPKKKMKDFGLNEGQIDLVLKGTAKQLRKEVAKEQPHIVVFRVKMG